MIPAWTSLRMLATLRRIAAALEAENELTRTSLQLAHPEFARRTGGKRTSKVVEIYAPSKSEWNEAYHAGRGEDAG